ncbi:hypothetical protein ACFY3N_12595 [Streptomyces sp. NPDC000348]|uniref:hypothetical protein n=1 Tax=Streptomyces sp. NPDC000348 TaxID=3364538 RepID=UPI0036BC2C2B
MSLAGTERPARRAEERAARERRLHYERWQWGGRLPSEGLRGARGSNVLGLLRFDSDPVHALDDTGPDNQRAVALPAARLACEAAGPTDVPWVTEALTALTRKRPLPPPFDDAARGGHVRRALPGAAGGDQVDVRRAGRARAPGGRRHAFRGRRV